MNPTIQQAIAALTALIDADEALDKLRKKAALMPMRGNYGRLTGVTDCMHQIHILQTEYVVLIEGSEEAQLAWFEATGRVWGEG